MDAQGHAALVAQIVEWFASRGGHPMSVKAHTGPETVYVAVGPFLHLEEHPVSKGVFRAWFDDSLNAGSGPDANRSIAFGFELEGAALEPARLVLDKGDQTIEIVDQWNPRGGPAAEDVVWDDGPAPSGDALWDAETVPPAPQPPLNPVAAEPPIPAPAVAPAPLPQAVPPAPQPPVAAPVPVSGPEYVAVPPGGAFQMNVKAPLWGNALGSKFMGIVTVRVEQGWVTIVGQRSTGSSTVLVAGGLLLVFAGLALFGGLFIAAQATSNSDMGAAFCGMGIGLLLGIPGLILYLVGRNRAMRSGQGTLQFRVADAQGRKVRYDSNVGCLISLLLTPVIGLIVMLVQGRRMMTMTVPSDPGSRAPRMQLVLKALSSADGAILGQALRG